ncbi:hypothetical protein LCGC14_2834540 [marine sediment metagenome]|uniref:Uncharacterized protein n=1 Tax=marine sediment metagenome TaxID=412755 RepID=A0A0F9ALG0_9ZZZZ
MEGAQGAALSFWEPNFDDWFYSGFVKFCKVNYVADECGLKPHFIGQELDVLCQIVAQPTHKFDFVLSWFCHNLLLWFRCDSAPHSAPT